ncbi:MAG: hypothetical protein U0167_04215 [bacterium]
MRTTRLTRLAPPALLAAMAALLASSAPAAVLHVPADYPTIASAVAAAGVTDTVTIACGTYVEHGISRSGLSITLRSDTGDSGCVVIDAGGAANILTLGQGQGVSIRGIVFQGASQGASAIAVSVGGSDVSVENCVFRGNRNGLGISTTAYVDHCSFLDNTASGLSVAGSVMAVHACLFVHNGTAVYVHTPADGSMSAYISHSLFRENTGATLDAEGTRETTANVEMQYCTLYHEGAGILADDGSVVTVGHCILAYGSHACVGRNRSYVYCTDSYGNVGGDWPTQCFIYLSGNFSAPPFFCDGERGDFSLRADSPCAPGVNTSCGLIGAFDVGCGAVSIEPSTWGKMKASYRG